MKAEDTKMRPKPDRSNHVVQTKKESLDDFIDIGWDEGFLSDARPYRAECWAESGITMLTFFFSTNGLETSSESELRALLEQDGLIKFTGEEAYLTAMPMTDASGNDMWSVNIVVGDEEKSFIEDSLKLRRYS